MTPREYYILEMILRHVSAWNRREIVATQVECKNGEVDGKPLHANDLFITRVEFGRKTG